jgi:long-chain acyl-CoA synthetase
MPNIRIFDYLFDQLNRHPLERAFGHKTDNGWTYLSTREVVDLVNRTSAGLLKLGLKPGDKIATVVQKTSPDWVILDFAMLQTGILNIPMYPTISAREYAYILEESEAVLCIAGDDELYEKVMAAKAGVPTLREVLTFVEHPAARSWHVLMSPENADLSEVVRVRDNIHPDDLATIIYTSGTTGNPKGVMLTHRNVVFNVEAMRKLIPIDPGDRSLSFLPVSHVFERAVVYAYTAYCASVSFTGIDKLGGEDGDLQAIKPHFFSAVPRLLEKVYERILSRGMALKGPTRWLFFWALKLTDDWEFDKSYTGAPKWARQVADKLVFSKWRAALGGNVKGIVTGASACPLRIMRTFNAAGVRVREGYGMTEAAPALSFNRFESGGAMLGTVGQILEGVDIIIEQGADYKPDEGEILAKGAGIMTGYYKQPDKTAESLRHINGEKWLVTGDVGRFVAGPGGQRFLQITDRKKELIKTSGGKYVAPTPIENSLKEHALVDQAMVVGENLKFVSALIVPSVDGLKDWTHRHGLPWTKMADMILKPEVIHRYQMLIDRINPFFGHAEQIKKFTLLADPWEQVKPDGSDAELTPSLKLKRRVILKKFEREIAAMYHDAQEKIM